MKNSSQSVNCRYCTRTHVSCVTHLHVCTEYRYTNTPTSFILQIWIRQYLSLSSQDATFLSYELEIFAATNQVLNLLLITFTSLLLRLEKTSIMNCVFMLCMCLLLQLYPCELEVKQFTFGADKEKVQSREALSHSGKLTIVFSVIFAWKYVDVGKSRGKWKPCILANTEK